MGVTVSRYVCAACRAEHALRETKFPPGALSRELIELACRRCGARLCTYPEPENGRIELRALDELSRAERRRFLAPGAGPPRPHPAMQLVYGVLGLLLAALVIRLCNAM